MQSLPRSKLFVQALPQDVLRSCASIAEATRVPNHGDGQAPIPHVYFSTRLAQRAGGAEIPDHVFQTPAVVERQF